MDRSTTYPVQHNATLDELKDEQRLKEFKIKKIVELTQLIGPVSQQIVDAANVVARATRTVIVAQGELRAARNELARLIL